MRISGESSDNSRVIFVTIPKTKQKSNLNACLIDCINAVLDNNMSLYTRLVSIIRKLGGIY